MLVTLIEQLPAESATKTAMRDEFTDAELAEAAQDAPDGHGPWSRTDLLLADVYDAVRVLAWITQAVNRSSSSDPMPPQPKPYPRPGVLPPDQGPPPDEGLIAQLVAERAEREARRAEIEQAAAPDG